jgi:hypothetical protein
MPERAGKWKLFEEESRYVDRFGLLLIITSIAVITLSLVDLRADIRGLRSQLGQIAVAVFVGATLLLSLRSSGVARRYRMIADVIIGLGVVVTIVFVVLIELSDAPNPVEGSRSISPFWVVLSALAPILVVRRLIRHQRASGRTLLGAVSAYLLLALAFNFAFITVDVTQATPFFGTEQPSTSFMYFSLVTITTLGYGDLAAVEPLGRLLTTIEAVIGQVYLVTFVAMIVGLMVEQRQRRTDEG